MYRHQNAYLYIQLMLQLYIMSVNFAALQLFIALKVLKINKFTLDCIVQYIAVS